MSMGYDSGKREYVQSLILSDHELRKVQQGDTEWVAHRMDRVRAQFAAELFKQLDDGRHHLIQIREKFTPPQSDLFHGFPVVEFEVRASVVEVEYEHYAPWGRLHMLPEHNYRMDTNWALTGAAWGEAEALSRAALREMRRRIRGWFARLGRKIRGVAQR